MTTPPTRLELPKVLMQILDLEEDIDFDRFNFHGTNIWALVRRDLWFNLHSSKLSGSTLRKRSIWSAIYRFIRSVLKGIYGYHKFRLTIKNAVLHRKKQALDILFISTPPIDSTMTPDGIYDNRIDPYLEDFQDEGYKCEKIQVRRAPISFYRDLKHTLTSYDIRDMGRCYSVIQYLLFHLNGLMRIIGITSNAEEIRRYLRLKLAKHHINDNAVDIENIFSFQLYEKLYGKILDAYQPKVLAVTFYANIPFMAAIQAARKRGIVAIDIQHGKQGKFHGMYSYLGKLPPETLLFLPDFFWVWGEESAVNINRHMTLKNGPRAIVGGNSRVRRYKSSPDYYGSSGELDKFSKNLKRYEKIILVTLQHDAEIPKLVLECAKQNNADTFWLFRRHPIVSRYTEKELVKTISAYQISSYDVENASKLPLYALLTNSTHHITGWSSSCYEALIFNVPTIFWEPRAKSLYADYLDNKHFAYANNSSELQYHLTKNMASWNFSENTPYISTCEISYKSAIDIVTKYPSSSNS